MKKPSCTAIITHHNKGTAGFKRLTLQEAAEDLKNMNGGYSGVINLDYKLKGQLISASILDYVFDSQGFITGLSSNYFYYDISEEVLKRSMARYGAREITRKQYLAKLEKYAQVPLKCEIGELFDCQKSSSSVSPHS